MNAFHSTAQRVLSVSVSGVSGSEVIVCHSWLNPILWYSIFTSWTTVFDSVPLEQRVQVEGLVPKLFSGTIYWFVFLLVSHESCHFSNINIQTCFWVDRKDLSLIRACERGHAWAQSFVASVWWRRWIKPTMQHSATLRCTPHFSYLQCTKLRLWIMFWSWTCRSKKKWKTFVSLKTCLKPCFNSNLLALFFFFLPG